MSRYAEIIIKLEESFRQHPYHCTTGWPTIGYGEVVGTKGGPLPNITVTKAEASKFVFQRIEEISSQLSSVFPKAWGRCNEARQAILISMVYQVGFNGISKFKKMWGALEAGNFELASREMLDSLWAKQTPNRAKRHSEQMKNGDMLNYYLLNISKI